MRKIAVTREIFDETIEYLESHFIVKAHKRDCPLSKEDTFNLIADVEGIQVSGSDLVDEEFLLAAPRLKIIANTAVGYNNIDVDVCSERGIMVTNTPGVLDGTVADYAMGLMISACRRMSEAERFLKQGKWDAFYFKELMGLDVHGATIGIFGFGRIGQEIAKRAQGFGMRVVYHSRNRVAQDVEKQFGAEYSNKTELLKMADIVMLILPYSAETHHFIGREELSLMKKKSVLINIARGGIVDDEALIKSLKAKDIYAAGLDVYENEPQLNKGFLELDNVTLSPHIGSASEPTRRAMAMAAAKNLVAVLSEDKLPPNWVNPR